MRVAALYDVHGTLPAVEAVPAGVDAEADEVLRENVLQPATRERATAEPERRG